MSYDILDDKDQKARIDDCLTCIQEAKQCIKQAEQKRKENLQYKSILFENGDNLVEGVFRILEAILDIDLSQFQDEKNEDFLIYYDSITFIGDIKGISTNIKSENISQVERHYQTYQDKLQEEGRQETVKQLLIINPLRNKPPDQRDPVHEIQINLARRNGCLIITTEILLKIFERFRNHETSTTDIKNVFSTEVGLLSMDAFETMKKS